MGAVDPQVSGPQHSEGLLGDVAPLRFRIS